MLLIISLIIMFIVFSALVSRKLNIPLILISLLIGIIFGSDVTGLIYFDNAQLAKKIANIALMFVLFSGGFGTKFSNIKPVLKVTVILSTFGVLITAAIAGILFHLISGWSLIRSFLMCIIISSTDAAAVFSILRTKSIKKNIATVTELESAANDPMAIIATTFVVAIIAGSELSKYVSLLMILWQLLAGIGIGIIVGYIGSYCFNKLKEIDVGYLYLFLIGIILLSFGLADLCKASGLLATFFTGIVIGNKKLPYKNGISSFTEILSFISNVGLFVLLGLLVFPKNFLKIWGLGFFLFFTVAFVARPLTVFICTVFTKFSFKEKIFLSWSGIRGAVPIVLATYPIAAGIDNEHQIFNIVFFTVTLSIIVQGTTIGKLSSLLKLSSKSKRKSKQTMELVTVHDTNYELIEIFIDGDLYSGECKILDTTLPVGTTITMINRNNSVIAPTGQTTLYPGDILSVLVDNKKIRECTNNILRMFNKKE